MGPSKRARARKSLQTSWYVYNNFHYAPFLLIDLVHYKVPTRGGRPNTSFIATSLGADVLSPAGRVKVLPTLQLENHPRILAGGDIIEWKEQKQAAKYPAHAAVIAKNAFALLEKNQPKARYAGSPELIAISFGKVCFCREITLRKS